MSRELTPVKRRLVDVAQIALIAAMAFAIGAALAGDLEPLIAVGTVTLLGGTLYALVKLFPRPTGRPREPKAPKEREAVAAAPVELRESEPRAAAHAIPEEDEAAEEEGPYGYTLPEPVPPATPPAAGASPPEAEPAPGYDPGPAAVRKRPEEGMHVLVVDDEDATRRLCSRILGNGGYRVSSAPDAALALALAREDPPKVLLTDLVLPGMTGSTLRDRMIGEVGDIAVLFMTSFAGAVRERYGLRADLDEVIEKPFEGVELLRAVDAVVQTRYPEGTAEA